jgi:hypothetical protein
MATFTEIHQIVRHKVSGSLELRDKVEAAILIAADTIIQGNDTSDPPWDQTAGAHDQRVKWAVLVTDIDINIISQCFNLAVVNNSAATQSQILGASDAAIQSAVNLGVDALAANLV